MKSLDLVSILVAGALGAFLSFGLNEMWGSETSSSVAVAGTGFAVGAGVQIGVRLFGVS